MSGGTVKIKYRNQWVEPDDVPALREAERQPTPIPPVDLEALPPGDLNAVGNACPAVRYYINAKGQVRSGLTTEQQEIARKILEKLG